MAPLGSQVATCLALPWRGVREAGPASEWWGCILETFGGASPAHTHTYTHTHTARAQKQCCMNAHTHKHYTESTYKQLGDEKSARSFSARSFFFQPPGVMDVRAFGWWMSTNACFFQGFQGLPKILGPGRPHKWARNVRGISGPRTFSLGCSFCRSWAIIPKNVPHVNCIYSQHRQNYWNRSLSLSIYIYISKHFLFFWGGGVAKVGE